MSPFRYCGYYYDPETGRFINADAYVSTGQGLSGNNMFAYCNNNPISFEDSGGYWAEYLVGAGVNIATTYIATRATGGEYTIVDVVVNGIAGAAGVAGQKAKWIANIFNLGLTCVYNAYSVYKNGGTIFEWGYCSWLYND